MINSMLIQQQDCPSLTTFLIIPQLEIWQFAINYHILQWWTDTKQAREHHMTQCWGKYIIQYKAMRVHCNNIYPRIWLMIPNRTSHIQKHTKMNFSSISSIIALHIYFAEEHEKSSWLHTTMKDIYHNIIVHTGFNNWHSILPNEFLFILYSPIRKEFTQWYLHFKYK